MSFHIFVLQICYSWVASQVLENFSDVSSTFFVFYALKIKKNEHKLCSGFEWIKWDFFWYSWRCPHLSEGHPYDPDLLSALLAPASCRPCRPGSALWVTRPFGLLLAVCGTPSQMTWEAHRLEMFLNVILKPFQEGFYFRRIVLFFFTSFYPCCCLWNTMKLFFNVKSFTNKIYYYYYDY